MTLISQMITDTTLIISDWAVVMNINSPIISLAIPPIRTWDTTRSFSGDWQPYHVGTKGGVEAAGIDQHFDIRVFLPYSINIYIGDRITRTDTSETCYIKKILPYEDHQEVLCEINKSSS